MCLREPGCRHWGPNSESLKKDTRHVGDEDVLPIRRNLLLLGVLAACVEVQPPKLGLVEKVCGPVLSLTSLSCAVIGRILIIMTDFQGCE